MDDEKTSTEQRQELIDLGRELIRVMRQVIEPINLLTCKLQSEADALVKDVMTEKTRPVKKQRIVYRPSGQGSDDKPVRTMSPAGDPPSIPLKKGKRACSICRKPGHRASKCPEKT